MPEASPGLLIGLTGLFGAVGSGLKFALLAFGVLILIILVFFRMAKGKAKSKGDLLVLEVDENRGEITERSYVRIGASSYVYVGSDGPRFLEVTPGTKIYRCTRGGKSVPCVLAYPRDILALRVDPELAAATHLLLGSEEMFDVATEDDAVKMLKALYDRMGRDERMHVILEGPTRVLFAFNLRKIVTGIMDIFAVEGATFFKHLLATASNVQVLERLYKALTEFAESRYKWMNYIAYVVIAIGVASMLIFTVLGGGGK